MAAAKSHDGMVAYRLSHNLRELRKELDVSTYELSRRLEAIGNPIRPNAITRIEMGDRRVDVDDLVALAIALNVTPNRLMMPNPLGISNNGFEMSVVVTGSAVADTADMWAWADGDRPLRLQIDGEPYGPDMDEDAVNRWRFYNGPHRYPELLAAVAKVLREPAAADERG